MKVRRGGASGPSRKVAACRNKCEGAEAYTKYKAADYYQLKTEEDIMKEIYLNGPVLCPLRPKDEEDEEETERRGRILEMR
eukprot:736922-Rhodomonas_salina.1